ERTGRKSREPPATQPQHHLAKIVRSRKAWLTSDKPDSFWCEVLWRNYSQSKAVRQTSACLRLICGGPPSPKSVLYDLRHSQNGSLFEWSTDYLNANR